MRRLATRFRGILRSKNAAKLGVWLTDVHQSGLYAMQRFARTLRRDIDAMRNAIAELDFADFCAVGSDAGPEDRRFRDDAHGLFDGGGGASKGAEWNPSFLPQ